MESSALIKKVRKIEIRTRALSQQIFAGQYHSAFKGRGMAFSEVRQYQYGDDVRFIDWNVTARFNQPFVKIFEEERELTVILLIDVSGSNQFGTQTQFKADLITELAAILSFSAIHNNDKVGVIFFSNQVEKFIPPQKGKTHILRIIRELLNHQPQQSQTNISEALRFLTNVIKKKCTAFLISDFVNSDFDNALSIAAKKHDIVALQVTDKAEGELVNLGLLKTRDPETGHYQWIDTSNAAVRKNYREWWKNVRETNKNIFKRTGVDMVTLYTGQDYVRELLNLFKRRA